jgi:hypothetical protein
VGKEEKNQSHKGRQIIIERKGEREREKDRWIEKGVAQQKKKGREGERR